MMIPISDRSMNHVVIERYAIAQLQWIRKQQKMDLSIGLLTLIPVDG